MHEPNSPAPRYGRIAIGLHWLLALMIVTSFSLGLSMADLPFSPLRVRLVNWHKWGGAMILALSAMRLLWRLAQPPPPLPEAIVRAMPRWQRVVHHRTLALLHLLFFAVPLLGWAYSSALGFPIVWFGVLPLPDFVPLDKALAETLLLPLHRASAHFARHTCRRGHGRRARASLRRSRRAARTHVARRTPGQRLMAPEVSCCERDRGLRQTSAKPRSQQAAFSGCGHGHPAQRASTPRR